MQSLMLLTLNRFEDGTEVTPELLIECGLVKKNWMVLKYWVKVH